MNKELASEDGNEGPHIVYERVTVPSEVVERQKESWNVSPTEYDKNGKEIHRKGYTAHAHKKRFKVGTKSERRKEVKYGGNFDQVSDEIAKEYEAKGYSESESKKIGNDTAADIYREKKKADLKKAMAVLVLAVVIVSGLTLVLQAGNSSGYKQVTMPWAVTGGIDPQLNITFNSVSYVDQPPQWNFSAAQQSYPGIAYTSGGDWILNNSGYLIFQNNTTAAGKTGFAQASFHVGPYLGTPVNYLATVQKVAFNGTGTTSYIVLSEGKQSGSPSISSNVIGTSGGSAQNILFIEFAYSSTGKNYTITVGYYQYNSAKYDNYTSKVFKTGLNPLTFGTFEIDMANAVTYVNYTNSANGSLIESSGALYPVLDNNTSAVAYNSYELPTAASTSNSSMILSYGLLLDRNTNTYTTSAGYSPAAVASTVSNTYFDPGASNSSYLQEPNATVTGSATFNQSTTFGPVLRSNSTSIYQATDLNTSMMISNASKNAEFNGSQAVTTLRATNSNSTSITANLNVYSWNANSIANISTSYLQAYISGILNKAGTATSPNDIFISGYVVTNVAIDVSFSNTTATQITNALDNAFPGFLANEHLTLVNTTTSAVVAGFEVGSFYKDGMAVQPIIHDGKIVNPFTYQVYNTPEAAGFPIGTYVSANMVDVPQMDLFVGPAGMLIFSQESIFGNIFGSLTSAGSAVNSFFRSGASTVTNVVGSVSKAVSPVDVIKTLSNTAGPAYTRLSQNVSRLEGTILPALSVIPSNIQSDLSRSVTNLGGVLSTTVKPISSGIADFRSQAVGALASGVHTFSQGIYNMRGYVNNAAHTAVSNIRNTVNKTVALGSAVLSPVYTAVSTLPTKVTGFASGTVRSISSAVHGALATGQAALDSVGHYITNTTKNGLSIVQDTLGKVGSAITSFGGSLKNGLGSIGNFFVGLGHGILVVLEYVGVGVVIAAIIIVIAFVLKSRAKAMPGSISLN